MSDKPSLQIDDDWKRQAQEEKRQLAEKQKAEEARRQQASSTPAAGTDSGSDASTRGKLPPVGFASLVQSMLAQSLAYLGDYTDDNGQPVVNLDLSKYYIDTLGMLEEKTAGNLTPEEQSMLDSALYQARMQYVNVATQTIR